MFLIDWYDAELELARQNPGETEVRGYLLNKAYASSTVKTHTNQIAQYERFLQKLDGFAAPWTEMSCILWVMDGLENGLKKATLRAKIAAFVWYASAHHRLVFRNVSPADPLYLLNRAIARLGNDAKPKLAVTGDMLGGIRDLLERVEPGRLATQALAWFVLSYAGMLRASETAHLSWEDVLFPEGSGLSSFPPTHMQVILKVSSSHIFKNHTSDATLRFGKIEDSRICPVSCMWEWWKVADHSAGRVFVLKVDHARALLKRYASLVSDNPGGDYGLHSLRAGGATDADAQGKSLGEIKVMGRWRSTTVLQYIRHADAIARDLGIPQSRGSVSFTAFANESV